MARCEVAVKNSSTAFNRIMPFYVETRYHPRTAQKLSTWPIQNFHIKENPATKTDHKPDMFSESQTPPWQNNLSKKNKGVMRYHHHPAGLSPGKIL